MRCGGEATEASPLLGTENGHAAIENGVSKPNANGTFSAAPRPGSSGDVEEGEARSISDGEEVVTREGIPEIKEKMAVLIPAIGIGVFLCALDQLLTAATYAKIGSDLDSLNSTSWIATAYFLTLTSFQPLYGKLSDIFGRKECLLFAYLIFGLGCLGCGAAQNIGQLCVARAVAGVGGGGMNSVVSILITDIVPLRDRGVWQGYINIIFAAGTSIGAPLGGFLADSIGWRWSFLAQSPICLIAFVTVYRVLHLPKTEHSHWLDKLSRVGSSIGISASSAVLQQVLRTQLAARLPDSAREIEEEVRKSLEYIKELEPETAKIVRRCYGIATEGAFLPTTVFLTLALIAAFFIKEKKLGR